MPDTQHELGLNGQTMLNTAIGSHNPSTPSTIISSPSGSTRPYSSPSPAALSPPSSVTADTSSLSHQAAIISVSNAVATAGGPSPQSIPSSKSNLQEAAAFVSGGRGSGTNTNEHHHHHHNHHLNSSSSSSSSSIATGNLISMNFQELY